MKHTAFLSVMDYSTDKLAHLFDVAIDLKKKLKAGVPTPILQGKTLAMIFQKPSLRTRVSFEIGMHQLGGYAFYLSPDEIGLGKREAIKDVAQVIAGYVDGIMARVFSHQHLVELAQYAGIPVINGLSDFNHPCQAMADGLTMIEEFGTLKGIHIAYIGDGNNVTVSLMDIAVKMGANFAIANPEKYAMPDEAIAAAQDVAKTTGSRLSFELDPFAAVKGANVIYTDTWVSMGQESEKAEREKIFAPYQVNRELVAAADPNCIVMHCLPSHRGDRFRGLADLPVLRHRLRGGPGPRRAGHRHHRD